MKTKEEIYCKNGGSYIRSAETEGHLKAMQEYADQTLEAYKAKLKEEFEKEWQKGNLGTIPKTILFKHIDDTKP